ncbi:MAG: hypothetical protein JWN34_3774 [Bryobacterales bacterium]|nr:hypothetical protein [Bryobacterales bacterium]
MTMPWKCFLCGSMDAACGHREPELIEWWSVASQTKCELAEATPIPTRRRMPLPRKTAATHKPAPALLSDPIPMHTPVPPIRGTRNIGEYSALRGW